MTKIDIHEMHQRMLEIIKEVHSIAERNHLSYYLAYGSYLGAVRHHGFIPWDDDMDIFVPIEEYTHFVEVMDKELPSYYHCASYKNHKGCASPFVKIEDTRTCIVDPRVDLPAEQQVGINIDLFPLVKTDNLDEVKRIWKWSKWYQLIYVKNDKRSLLKNSIKALLKTFCPISQQTFNNKVWELAYNMRGEKYMVSVFGARDEREFIPPYIYGKPQLIQFEDTELYGLEKGHEYLSRMYGDYMIPVPRDPHADNVYRK